VKAVLDGLAHGAARPITADHVAGPDRLDLAFMRGIEPLEPDVHRIGGCCIGLEIEKTPRIVRLKPVRRAAARLEFGLSKPDARIQGPYHLLTLLVHELTQSLGAVPKRSR